MRQARGRPSRRSLLWRLYLPNALALVLAVSVLALSPATVSWPLTWGDGVVLVAGLLVLLVANLALMHRTLAPLGRLWAAMRAVDPLRPGQRIDVRARSVEVHDLGAAFNDMLDRLEAERRDSARRAQAVQETERRRLSLELHDEVGQDLTALMLQLEVATRSVPAEQRARLESCRETTRECLDHVRGIARRLRPEVLDDLGLRSALRQLCGRVTDSGDLRVVLDIDRMPNTLNADAELVMYRVVQESLTNSLRHSGASRATVEVGADGGDLTVRVHDDGRGVGAGAEGAGIRGMRERAVLIGGTLRVADSPSGGTIVELHIPAGELNA